MVYVCAENCGAFEIYNSVCNDREEKGANPVRFLPEKNDKESNTHKRNK